MIDIDTIGRIGFTLFFYLWNIIEGAQIDSHYPHKLVVLYFYPLWRLFLLFVLLIGGLWCQTLGYMMAFAVLFYFMDMQLLLYREV